MKPRYLAMSLLALGALVAGSVATVSVTGELAKSKRGASASKHQYCPPQAGGGKGKPRPHGRGRKCGQQQSQAQRCGKGHYPGQNSANPRTRARVRAQKGRDKAACRGAQAERKGKQGGAEGRKTAQQRINRGMNR